MNFQRFLFNLQTRTDYVLALACVLTAVGPGFAADEPQPSVVFKDRTVELGLSNAGGSACWVDIDNDGWVDLCAGGGLWKNNAGKGFTRIFDPGAVVAADFDNDGFADLFSWSQVKLYRNDSGRGFVEFKLPELPKCVSRGACWGDFDGDGFVDLYIGGYEDWNAGITYPDMLLMNVEGKDFQLAWTDDHNRARGVTACDFDRDNDLDIYVSNYRLQPNLLWLNDGKGVFKDAATEYGAVATSEGFPGGHSIGAAWGDFDNDGNIDLYFTTVYGMASFNKPNYPVLYRNDGAFTFADATASAKLSEQPPTYQAAWADFDNDGDLDLLTADKLFENQGSDNRWIKIRLRGDGRVVNRSAIGAQVRIKLRGKVLTGQVEAGTGEGNQNDLTLHFGLGPNVRRVAFDILWPNGKTQKVWGIRTNRTIDVEFRTNHKER